MISYKDAGVDKEEGYRAVDLIKESVSKTHNKNVLTGLGSFASLYELTNYREPVLVSGTDGVGTKLALAFENKIYNTVGQDCFAMCANDILCQGAKPLFFLDYLACGRLEAEVSSQLVLGMAKACEEADCALVGGETAEMPGFYKEGDYDMAGFCVGAVEKSQIINGSTVKEGDLLIGLPSSGVHSNGFSLVRSLIDDFSQDFMGSPLYQTLLEPTRVYVSAVQPLLKEFQGSIHGMAHITGGGIPENLPRTLPQELYACIDKKDIPKQPIFDFLQNQGVSEDEMWGTFNMGVGYILVVDESAAQEVMTHLSQRGEYPFILGDVKAQSSLTKGQRVCFL